MGQPSDSERATSVATILTVAPKLASLSRMTGAELAEKHLIMFGEPPRSRNPHFLRKRLAWRIQELAEGGLSDRALARIEELGADALGSRLPAKEGTHRLTGRSRPRASDRDPRLPLPGSVLVRSYRDEEHRITVLDDGFEYQGQKYRSLSKIARLITGTPWNGFLFFLGRAATRRSPGAGRQ
jgi:hypothetical protein